MKGLFRRALFGDMPGHFPLSSVAKAITRHFSTLTTGLGTYWEYAKPLEFQAGDRYKINFLSPTAITASRYYLTGSTVANGSWVYLSPDGTYQMAAGFDLYVGGVLVDTDTTYHTDGKFREMEFVFTGMGSISILAKQNNDTNFYSGIFFDNVATISGVKQSYTLGNPAGEDVELCAENVFGVQLLGTETSASFILEQDGVIVGSTATSGSATHQTARFMYANAGIQTGQLYEVTINKADSSEVFIDCGDGGDVSAFGVGPSTVVVKAGTGAFIDLRFASTNSSAEITSIRSITNAIKRENVPPASIKEMEFIGGRYIGTANAITNHAVVVLDGTEAAFTSYEYGIENPDFNYVINVVPSNVVVTGEYKMDATIVDSAWVTAPTPLTDWENGAGNIVFGIQKRSDPLQCTLTSTAKRIIEVAS